MAALGAATGHMWTPELNKRRYLPDMRILVYVFRTIFVIVPSPIAISDARVQKY